MNKIVKGLLAILAVLIVLSLSPASFASMFKYFSVQKLNNFASDVGLFQCNGKSVRENIDSDGSKTVETEYLLKVIEVYKTDPSNPLKPGDERVVRLWGRPPSERVFPYVKEMPEFYVGQEYIIFFGRPSKTSGLVSPVGLWQGVQFVVKEKDGTLKVSNKFNNKGLFNGVTRQLKGMGKAVSTSESMLEESKKGSVDYDSFSSILRKLNE